MNAADDLLLTGSAQDTALLCGSTAYTYAELNRAVGHMASLLREHGLQRGEHVGLFSKNSLFWVATYLAALKTGSVCVPIPFTTTPQAISDLVVWTNCRLLCLAADTLDLAAAIPQQCIIVDEAEFCLRLQSAQAPPDLPSWNFDGRTALAALMLTSGSTRRSRAVMITHANILANTRSIIACLGLTRAERMLCHLPLSYCFGLSLLHTHLAVGGSLVLTSGMLQPSAAYRIMLEGNCTGFAGVPSVFQVLLRGRLNRSFVFPPSIRKIQQAGGKLAAQLLAELREAAPHAEIFVMYGQTEATARLTCLQSDALLAKPGSVGLPIPGVTIRLLAPDGSEVQGGETGQVVVSGEGVASGYWGEPQLTSTVFQNGSLYTGDLGYVDGDGCLYLAGRSQDFIKSGGVRVSLSELEESVMAVPEVLEAAAVPVPDRVRGEAVRLVVVIAPGSSLAAATILRHCRGTVSNHLVPREILFLPELPKNASGKVVKAALTGDLPPIYPIDRSGTVSSRHSAVSPLITSLGGEHGGEQRMGDPLERRLSPIPPALP